MQELLAGKVVLGSEVGYVRTDVTDVTQARAHRWDRTRINGLSIGWSDTDGENQTRHRSHGAGARTGRIGPRRPSR